MRTSVCDIEVGEVRQFHYCKNLTKLWFSTHLAPLFLESLLPIQVLALLVVRLRTSQAPHLHVLHPRFHATITLQGCHETRFDKNHAPNFDSW